MVMNLNSDLFAFQMVPMKGIWPFWRMWHQLPCEQWTLTRGPTMEELQDLIFLLRSIWFYVKRHKKSELPRFSILFSRIVIPAEDLCAILSTELCSKLHTVFPAVFPGVQTNCAVVFWWNLHKVVSDLVWVYFEKFPLSHSDDSMANAWLLMPPILSILSKKRKHIQHLFWVMLRVISLSVFLNHSSCDMMAIKWRVTEILFMLRHMAARRKALTALLRIQELTETHDWFMLLWLTREKVTLSLPHVAQTQFRSLLDSSPWMTAIFGTGTHDHLTVRQRQMVKHQYNCVCNWLDDPIIYCISDLTG